VSIGERLQRLDNRVFGMRRQAVSSDASFLKYVVGYQLIAGVLVIVGMFAESVRGLAVVPVMSTAMARTGGCGHRVDGVVRTWPGDGLAWFGQLCGQSCFASARCFCAMFVGIGSCRR
jgi:hypothetical protein